MRASFLALGALAAAVVAQDTYWNITSKPFYLVIKAQNVTLNGKYLGACHEGAAIEGLCVTTPSTANYVQFNYNTSVYQQPSVSGLLIWNLIGVNGGTLNVSSTMRFSYNSGSNVALPIFLPGNSDYTQVSFDNDGKLGIGSFQDDTKPLPNYTPGYLYRWNVCTTYYGYLYSTLAWTVGIHSPQNPTCQKVDIYRKFV